MTNLSSCPDCSGFVPGHLQACPHCAPTPVASRVLPRLARRVLGLGTGGLLAMTLMACYGLPPCDPDDTEDPYCAPAMQCPAGEEDLDEDGVCTPDDCADMDPMIYPLADDPEGDDIDQNCDGEDGVKG